MLGSPVIDSTEVAFDLLHLGAAFLLALPVAMDPEAANPGAGLRTFPLVAIAAADTLWLAYRSSNRRTPRHVFSRV